MPAVRNVREIFTKCNIKIRKRLLYRDTFEYIKFISTSIPNKNKLSYIHNVGEQPLKYKTVGQCLEEAANKWPNIPWITSCYEDINLTFSQVLEQADKFAAGLVECGLKQGDRIGICCPNSSKWIITMMAAARAGLILVTINPSYQESELEYCMKKVGIKCLVVPKRFRTQNFYNMLVNIEPGILKSQPGSLKSERLPELQTVILTDNEKELGVFTFNDILKLANTSRIQNINSISKLIQPDDGCNIQFTSGTTGKPKAALLSHFNFVNNGFIIGKRNELSKQQQKMCVQVPLFHAFGVVIVTMASLQYGTTVVFPSASYNPEEILKSIEKERCTVLTGTPTMYVDLLNCQRKLNLDIKSPELAITGGAPCSPELFRRIQNELHVSTLKSVYGMTETSASTFQSLSNETIHQATETVGYVQEHVEVKIVDKEGNTVPFGVPGELWTRGYNTMIGYWEDPEKTAEMITPTKWLKTGDQFILQEDGYGKVVGRLKDVIIRGGENIYPKEIEDYLNTHPVILESQVFGVNDERMGEEICASVRVKEGYSINHEEVKNFCHGKIAHYKIPRYLKVVNAFPKTTSGKIQKYKLKDMFEKGQL